MSEASKAARAAMKKKIERITGGDPHAKVDASSWTPPEPLNTEAKTGLRPVSRRQFKKGGKVVAMMGEKAKKHAGRKPRKDGGRSLAKDIVNRNVKDANAEFGKPHVGGFKKGGHADAKADKSLIKKMVKPSARTGKDIGGALLDMATSTSPAAIVAKKLLGSKNRGDDAQAKKRGGAANYEGGTRPTGGRIARKDGGRAKGKTNINIIIGAGHRQEPQVPPSQMAPVRPPVPMPMGPPPGAMPPPQAAPMPMPGAGAGLPPPPMQRKSGGRVGNRRYRSFKDMDAGAGGALGRLEKTEIQEHKG